MMHRKKSQSPTVNSHRCLALADVSLELLAWLDSVWKSFLLRE